LIERAEHGVSPPTGPSPQLVGIDHVALALAAGTLDAALRFYRDGFGFTVSHRQEERGAHGGMRSVGLTAPGERVRLVLLEPLGDGGSGQIEDFLAVHRGPGVQHLALRTTDIVATVRALHGHGITLLSAAPSAPPNGGGSRMLSELGIFAARQGRGTLYQGFVPSLHTPGQLFVELVQRDGAEGFSGENVRGLFAALATERARAALAR